MMYLLTEQQHAQIVDALSIRDVRLHESALAMLKAMKPVTPSLYSVTYRGSHVANFHLTQSLAEQQMQRLDSSFPENKRAVVPLYAKEQQ